MADNYSNVGPSDLYSSDDQYVTKSYVDSKQFTATNVVANQLSDISTNLGNITEGSLTGVSIMSSTIDKIDFSVTTATNISASSVDTGTFDFSKIGVSNFKADWLTSGILDFSKFTLNNFNGAWTDFSSSLLLSWVIYGNGYRNPSYMKNVGGQVRLSGAMMSGTNGTIFTLPVGLRPADTITMLVSCGDTTQTGSITIDSSGNISVNIPSGLNTFVSLDGISWYAES